MTKYKISAGTLIKLDNKILFCHPTNSSWVGTFGPAKGGVNDGESLIDAAIRETQEEIGITITKEMISNLKTPIEIIYYKNKEKDIIHKKVFLFNVEINNLSELKMDSDIVPKNQLQIEEIDWAGFLSKEELEEKSSHRFLSLINKIL